MSTKKAGSRIKITLVKSACESTQGQRDTLSRLGVMKPNQSVIKDNTESIAGMVFKVNHLVKVEEI
jgi:large subunit ribosomal protein L30